MILSILRTYICLNFLHFILYNYFGIRSCLPEVNMFLYNIWNYTVNNFNNYINDLWTNFSLETLYDKLYGLGCFIFMPLYHSYVFKSCKNIYNTYVSQYIPAESLPKYLLTFVLICYLILRLKPKAQQQRTSPRRSSQPDEGVRTPQRRRHVAYSEPLSDDEEDFDNGGVNNTAPARNNSDDVNNITPTRNNSDDVNNITPTRNNSGDLIDNTSPSRDNVINNDEVDLSSYRNSSHRVCPVCKHYEFNAVLLPCGHTALCLKCALKYYYYDKKCPVCKKAIWTIHRIYL